MRPNRRWILGALAVKIVAILLCLIPKSENDLFYELRIGADILRTGHVPRVDHYSWIMAGRPWDAPEWLAWVIYALAYKHGHFLGTFLVMAVAVVTTAIFCYGHLARRDGVTAGVVMTTLMLFCLRDCIQERPYVYSYLLLAMTLSLILRAREMADGTMSDTSSRASTLLPVPSPSSARSSLGRGASRKRGETYLGNDIGSGKKGVGSVSLLTCLALLCALWTNLHQGVFLVVCVLVMYAIGDVAQVLWLKRCWYPDIEWRRARCRRNAVAMLLTALACAVSMTVSPYGWHVYKNIAMTLHNESAMSHVTEWEPITVVPLLQMSPFLLMAGLTLPSIAFSRRRSFGDILVITAFFVESLLHARNIAIFCIAAAIIGARHFGSALRLLRRIGVSLEARKARQPHPLLSTFGVLALGLLTAVVCMSLRRAEGPRGLTLEGVGEAVARVPSYPDAACAFLQTHPLPADARILNNFEIGGYLMWRLPKLRVFTDGRLDLYSGQPFDDMLALARVDAASNTSTITPAWRTATRQYDFNCVITTSAREAAPFEIDPAWRLVYADPIGRRPRCRVFLPSDHSTHKSF